MCQNGMCQKMAYTRLACARKWHVPENGRVPENGMCQKMAHIDMTFVPDWNTFEKNVTNVPKIGTLARALHYRI